MTLALFPESLRPPVQPITLRDYQADAVQGLRESIARGSRRVILQAATGAGKTVMAAEVVKGAVEKGRRVVFFAHRRELLYQTKDKLDRFGLDDRTSLLMAGERVQYLNPVQVASVDTVRSRCLKNGILNLPEADVVVIDECHRSLSPTYLRLIALYASQGAVVLGLTATPCRGDGRGLGGTWEALVRCPDIDWLTAEGFLVPGRYFAPSVPDLTGVRTQNGDYSAKQLEAAMDKAPLVGDVVSQWARICPDRPTVVFASGVKHSMHLAEQFRSEGVRAEHIDGHMERDERDALISRLRKGETQVVTNCAVLTEGFDCPQLSCCVLARPTKSLGLYLQMVGRVLRTHDSKHDAVIIDHSGSVYRHGFADTPRDWQLDPDTRIQDREASRKTKEAKLITCIECQHTYSGRRDCPECGWTPQRVSSDTEWVDGELREVDSHGNTEEIPAAERELWFRELLGFAQQSGFKPGWAKYKYRNKFGRWPDVAFSQSPLPPSVVVQRYARHEMIRYAKAKRAQDETTSADAG